MARSDEKLGEIAAQLKKGIVPAKETVRSLLSWFGCSRRGFLVRIHIRSRLEKYGIETEPDFAYAYINGLISFVPATSNGHAASADVQANVTDPTYRIGQLESANNVPVSLSPDATLQQAVTLMLLNDFSQLPVMTSPREVKGVVSWKSIGSRLALKRTCTLVRECMDRAAIVTASASLFSVIAAIASSDYVLVRADDKSIGGIVTASDINDQFRRLAEPFLIVGEIESGMRCLIHGKFNAKELDEARVPGGSDRAIAGVADLTFGEYVRLIEEEKRWRKLRLEIDRVEFVSRLNKIRQIRNDVMHFTPDALEPTDMELLNEFAYFLRRLRAVGVA